MFTSCNISILSTGVVFLALLRLPVAAYHSEERQADRHSPVILVPGDGGNQLEAKLDKPEIVHYFCNRKTEDYFSLWLNLELLVPYVIDCWIDNMRMVYDNETRTTSNSPGVDIRVPGFGNTTSLDWLDPSQISPSAYFVNIIDMLVTEGYTREVDIRGAPYDFRKAPNEMADYFKRLKNLTEDTYEKNSQTKVTFICHSMGCPIMSYFFNQQTQAWKDQYIKALVSLAGAWGGAVKAIKTFASGDNLGVFVISETNVRKEQRTCPSLAYIMPSDLLWGKDEILMMTANKNYTVSNYNEFFQDIGFPDGYEMYKDTYKYARAGLNPPGVEVHCLHGLNVNDTVVKLDFRNTSNFPDKPKLIYGDGDGTVNIRSLQACLQWQGKQKQKIYHAAIHNVDHLGILADAHALEYIKNVVHQW